jgi:nicotinate-nucleotide pyrophosphorylase (carboxylating)
MTIDPVDPIEAAIREDLGKGDITTDFLVPSSAQAVARIIANEKAVLGGTEAAAEVFRRIDPALQVELRHKDGMNVNSGDAVMEIRGPTRPILKSERVALNFLQRLSGIATLTRKFVDAAANPQVKILDTRKTTPGLRVLEKAAVVAGGGANHRFGLFDMVLVKDNHLTVCGLATLRENLRRLRENNPQIRIEIEADHLEQVRTFLQIDEIDVILLDNMKPAQIREAVALGKMVGRDRRARQGDRVRFEASGGVTLKNIRQIAATGVDYISIGALTHSAHAIDLSLEITPLLG